MVLKVYIHTKKLYETRPITHIASSKVNASPGIHVRIRPVCIRLIAAISTKKNVINLNRS